MAGRIVAIAFIFVCTVVAWVILGMAVVRRTSTQDSKMRNAVGQLWGTEQAQTAPEVYYQTTREVEVEREVDGKTVREPQTRTFTHRLPLRSSTVDVGLSLQHRKKGLLWYPTYTVSFSGRYVVENPTDLPRNTTFRFAFPSADAVYDSFHLVIDGHTVDKLDIQSGNVTHTRDLAAGEQMTVDVVYNSQGLDTWGYGFGKDVSQIRDFHLTMTTDFADINFPENSISPTHRTETGDGWKLEWRYSSLLTGVEIAMDLPNKLNPGPWVERVTWAAPVSLFLFFFILFMFTALRGIKLHPMHYFFIAAAFFSFHLLLAYLVDHTSILTAFVISSAVSVLLVVTYMRLVVSNRFAFVEIALSQLVYLVLFSYTFFFEGFTGLAITILAIATLFVVMQFTGRVNWETAFQNAKGGTGESAS